MKSQFVLTILRTKPTQYSKVIDQIALAACGGPTDPHRSQCNPTYFGHWAGHNYVSGDGLSQIVMRCSLYKASRCKWRAIDLIDWDFLFERCGRNRYYLTPLSI